MEKVDFAAEEDLDLVPRHTRRKPPITWCLSVIIAHLVIFALVLSYYFQAALKEMATMRASNSSELATQAVQCEDQSVSNLDDGSKIEECGSSIMSAMAVHCQLDPMTGYWIPKRCYEAYHPAVMDTSLVTETGYLGAQAFGVQNFSWFEDENFTKPLKTVEDMEQFLAGRERQGIPAAAFTHVQYHSAHCSYMNRILAWGLSQVMAGETDVWIPQKSTDLEHAWHCEDVLGSRWRQPPEDELDPWGSSGFGPGVCIRIS